MDSFFGKSLIILDGYSFRKKSSARGKTYWYCCNEKCNAKGALLKDGSFMITTAKHNHEPDNEKIKCREKLLWLKKLALQLDVSGRELLKAVGMRENDEKALRYINTCRRRYRSRILPRFKKAGKNYKYLPSLITKKSFLCHSGFLYKPVAKRDNIRYWKCVVKTCKATGKTFGRGYFEIITPCHNHSLKEAIRSTSLARVFYTDKIQWNRKSVILSQKRGKDKSASVSEVEDYYSSTNSDSSDLEKLIVETLNGDYYDAPELQ